MTHKHFVRLFISFLFMAIVLILIPILHFTVNSYVLQNRWMDEVVGQFMTNVSQTMMNMGRYPSTVSEVEEMLVSSMDDKISGILINDMNGDIISGIGRTYSGKRVDIKSFTTRSRQMYFNSDFLTDTSTIDFDGDIHEIKISYPQYHVYTDELGRLYVDTLQSKEDFHIAVPGDISRNEISGSFLIDLSSGPTFVVNVLTLTPLTFSDTKNLLVGYISPLRYSIIAAFALALIYSWYMSKRNKRYTDEFKNSLRELAKGNENVELPKVKIDEFKEINKSIASLDRQLAHNRKTQREWLRNISHDLNTPATSMQLLIDGMIDGLFDSSYLPRLKKESDILNARIANVMAYSELQNMSLKIQKQSLNVLDFADGCLENFSSDERSRIIVEVDDSSFICGDPMMLNFGLTELLKNALNYSSDKVRLVVSSSSITVINKGHFKDPENVFEPWVKGENEGRSGDGCGLGLTIANRIATLHDAELRIENVGDEVHVSCIFTAQFPSVPEKKNP